MVKKVPKPEIRQKVRVGYLKLLMLFVGRLSFAKVFDMPGNPILLPVANCWGHKQRECDDDDGETPMAEAHWRRGRDG